MDIYIKKNKVCVGWSVLEGNKKRNWAFKRLVTQVAVVVGQPVEHGVECADEEVVSQLHDGQPHQVPQEKPGQHTAPETHH